MRIPLGLLDTSAYLRRLIQRTRAEQQQVQHTATMRVALLLVASAHAFVRPTLHALRSPTQRPALSPEMAGAIAKAKDAAGYEAIVQETMVKEDCTYEEAVERYNQYLFDPDGYSIIKMNEQIRDAGFNSYEEYFIAEKGQEAWDQRQADLEADKLQKRNTSFVVVGSLLAALTVYQNFFMHR